MIIGRKKIIYVIIGFFCVSAAGFFAYRQYRHYQAYQKQQAELRRKRVFWDALNRTVNNAVNRFEGRVGLVIKDLSTNWEITYNKDVRFPSASLVKIPVLIASLYAVEEGRLHLKEPVMLKESDKTDGSGILKTLRSGTQLEIEELLDKMITRSDNTAANILISLLGFDYLNETFQKLGLRQTNLSRKMMDFRLRGKGVENYTTAGEMAELLEQLYRNKIINGEMSQLCLTLMKQQHVNDRIPAKLPPNTVVAHKTGLERFVCHDVGIIYTVNGDYLICVLTKGEQGSRRAKELISDLALFTYAHF